jgi:hypothetical protein
MSVRVGRRQPVLGFNVWFAGRRVTHKTVLLMKRARDVGVEQGFDSDSVGAAAFEDGKEAFLVALAGSVGSSLFHY